MMNQFYLLSLVIVKLHRILNVVVICWSFVILCSTQAGDVKPRREKYLPDYRTYHNLTSIREHIEMYVERAPQFMRVDYEFVSRQKYPQFLIHIYNSSAVDGATTPPRILFSYGEHAREFFPVESMLDFLRRISHGLSTKNSVHRRFARNVVNKVDLFIVGIVNPDGRRHIENTGNYCWRGTSSGVDINRNFDWNFAGEGSSNDKTDEEYRGPHAFSEPECFVLRDLTVRYKFDAFFSFHSGIKQIYLPFADTVSRKTHRVRENDILLKDLAQKISKSTIHELKYGQAYDLNDYTADGTVFDFMAGVRHIPFSYAIEMWGIGDKPNIQCFDLFNPPSFDLRKSLKEMQPIYDTIFEYLIKWKRNHLFENVRGVQGSSHSLTYTGVFLLTSLLMLIYILRNVLRHQNCLRFYPQRRIISLRSLSSTFALSK
ncbi:zinc carboxypeptidase-like [Tubulanus polymorphus]|uniref:zinc carboxypeptidase-like n=1 Tax=Tubulanus polymorphus TaxID=672921 RepID=UPI003DA3748F